MSNVSNIERVFSVLAKNPATPGITAKMLARKSKISESAAYRVVHRLREEGNPIYTNTRLTNTGKIQKFYRLAA